MGDDLEALPDLDTSVYENLASAFRAAADDVLANFEGRLGQAEDAMKEWQGLAAQAFVPRFNQGIADGNELYQYLQRAATLIDGQRLGRYAATIPDPGERTLLAAARRENRRRYEAREWLRRRDQYRDDDFWSPVKEFFGAQPDWETIPEIGPLPAPVEEPFLQAPANPGGDGPRTRHPSVEA